MTLRFFPIPAVLGAGVLSLPMAHAGPAPVISTEAAALLEAQGGEPFSSAPGDFMIAGGITYFAASNSFAGTGRELWLTTSAGVTTMTADINPGAGSSNPLLLGALGTAILFSADDGVHGRELWKVDAAGPVMIKDLNPGSGGSGIARTWAAGSLTWFVQSVRTSSPIPGFPGPSYHYLWRTDGTASGTVRIADLGTAMPFQPVSNGTFVWYVTGARLYRTDGTPGAPVEVWNYPGETLSGLTVAGTQLYVASHETLTLAYEVIGDQTQSSFPVNAKLRRYSGTALPLVVDSQQSKIGEMRAVGSRLFYQWKRFTTPPSVTGTYLNAGVSIEGLSSASSTAPASVIGLPAGESFKGFRAGDGTRAYFLLRPPGFGTNRLYSSDGGPAVFLKDTGLEGAGPEEVSFATLSGSVIFPVLNGDLWEMWKTSGTAAGTAYVSPAPGGAYAAVGGVLYYVHDDGIHGSEPWRTDGTGPGTYLLKDVNPSPGAGSSPDWLTAVPASGATPAKLWFQAGDGVHGTEPWSSSGSGPGTLMAADVATGGTLTAPSGLATSGDTLFFQWETPEAGLELWRSDGTATGTHLLRDIRPGVDSSLPGTMVELGNLTLFTADDGEHGIEWWKTDGTAGGTELLIDLWPGPSGSAPSSWVVWNGHLYFAATNDLHGTELWRTDGTTLGTVLVKDCRTGPDGSSPAGLTATDGLLFFTADDGATGAELWRSDGTGGGTNMVFDLQPGIDGSSPGPMASLGGMVVFEAGAGSAGRELWRSNGLPGGTQFLKDLNTGAAGAAAADWTRLGPRLLFTAALGSSRRLWSTDGTVAGTVNLTGCGPLPLLTVAGSRAFFSNGELWATDGTTPGTAMVKDILPGAGNSFPQSLTAQGETLWFTAAGQEGRELWHSDGTMEGTGVSDIHPGASSSSPESLTVIGGALVFTAGEPAFQRELWTASPGHVPNLVDEIETIAISPFTGPFAAGTAKLFYFVQTSAAPGAWQLRTARISGFVPPQTPHTAMTLPGRIECEHFDLGAEGVAYHDTTPADSGGKYRISEAVDLAASTETGGGFAIVDAAAGEWTEYTVTVAATGFYEFQCRLFSSTGAGSFHLEVDGVPAAAFIAPASPGPLWSTVTVPLVRLTAGSRVLRLHTDAPGADANWFHASLTAANTPPDAGVTVPVQGDIFAPDEGVSFTAVTFDSSDAVSSVEFILDGVSAGTDTAGPPWAVNWTAVPGTHVLRVRATDSFGAVTLSPGRLFFVAEPLISWNAGWLYSTKEYPDWTSPGYDDRQWEAGKAPLGYGFGDETTLINGGTAGARRVTTFFRHTFEVPAPVTYVTLKCDRDDGLVAWINGDEAARSNLPEGPVDSHTLAVQPVGPAFLGGISRREDIALSGKMLPQGRNVLAIALHQQAVSGSNSNDLRLDAALFAVDYNPGDVLTTVPKNASSFFIRWPDYLSDWKLQSSSDLVSWTDYPGKTTLSGGLASTVADYSGRRQYFRLVREF